ncbi:hypothetical protein BC937DRAFT_91217 [Endogone sp. FLAS-F59071]|nr:hypothetical protein BC937DRAFT_91217 [Endogone sp. FLAS-F59071]|eukprot:RUS16423.1 hypothetical protein BC937DRAFT_91217 [Endogone sp. FLAS-F59071]
MSRNPSQHSKTYYRAGGDVLLCVGQVHFKVHSEILRRSSPYFASILANSYWIENNPNAHRSRRLCPHDDPIPTADAVTTCIRLRGRDPQDIKILLSILYTDTLSAAVGLINSHNVICMLDLADYLAVESVKEACEVFLCANIAKDPMVTMMMAEQYGLETLYRKTLVLIIRGLEKRLWDGSPFGKSWISEFDNIPYETRRRLIEGLLCRLKKTIKKSRRMRNPPKCYQLVSAKLQELSRQGSGRFYSKPLSSVCVEIQSLMTIPCRHCRHQMKMKW